MTGGAGYIGSFAVKALARRARRRRLRQPARRATREAIDRLNAASPGRTPIRLVVGDIRDRGRARRRADRAPGRRGHALRGVAARRRVGQPTRSATTTTTSAARWPCSAAMADAGVPALHLLVHVRDVRRAASACRSTRTIRSGRSTPTARPSWRSSGRCRTSSAPTASASVALRYFNAAGADPDGLLGEDHRPGDPPDPARHRRGLGRRAARRSSATTTRRPTAPACATTSTSSIWPTRTCWRSAHLAGRRLVARLQPRHRHGRISVRDVIARRRARDRPAGAAHDRPAARPAIRRRSTRRAERIRRDARLDAAATPTSTPSSTPRGSGARRHPGRLLRRRGRAGRAA